MIVTRMRRIAAVLSVALTFGLSARVEGSYTLTTSTSGVTYSGGSLTMTSLSSGQIIFVGGGSVTVGVAGGSSYLDASGSTLYLINDSRTAGITAIPNEQIYVTNTTTGATDTGIFAFSTNILVTNNGATGTFVEGPSSLIMNLANGDANYQVTAGSFTPPSIVIGGSLFTSSNPQGTSGGINSQSNGAISAVITSSVVPEPSSLLMLGLGSMTLGGIMIRRRRSRA